MRRQIGCIAMMIVWMSVGGCMNAGYTYKVTSVNVDGMLPLKAEGARLVKKERFGLWDMSAMRAVDRYVNEAGIWGTSVSVNVKKKGCSNDSPLWERIPSFATLTILPLYATQGATYEIQLVYPKGKAPIEMAIKGHGLVSFFPTGLLPIPGWFQERAWTAGGEAFVSGDCGMRKFTERAIEESTYDWLKGGGR